VETKLKGLEGDQGKWVLSGCKLVGEPLMINRELFVFDMLLSRSGGWRSKKGSVEELRRGLYVVAQQDV